MTKKLKDLLSEVFEDVQKVDRHKVSEGVRNFGIVGKSLYNNSNIMEVAEQLAGIAESAHHHILGEQDDWFDKISVNKNMKSLKGNVMEFQKTAKEAHMLNQRLTGLYEDIGHVLNRYYEIDEDAGDMDNDGKDEPDSEEYMDNKDKAIKSAMKNERLGDPDNRDMVSRPDGADRDGRDSENEALDVDKTADKGDEPDYPARDGEEMKESSNGHRTDAGHSSDSGDGNDSTGEEIKEDKGDMDNDGKDEPDSDEYMDNKDKAIKKAIKKEGTIRLKDIVNGIVGLGPVGKLRKK
jgi:hypothetical protein